MSLLSLAPSPLQRQLACFPKTRYQGSKRKLLPWLAGHFEGLSFDTALDAFGGTGAVSYLLKAMGKQVFYNDGLAWNRATGQALIENAGVRLSPQRLHEILQDGEEAEESGIVERLFEGIYFLPSEDRWLDRRIRRIEAIDEPLLRAIAFWCLCQSALIKRPYNLFHRKNLSMRLNDVKRSFGNKATWDRSFEAHFLGFAEEIDRAIFSNGRENRAFTSDIFDLSITADLVYLDPPYIPAQGPLTLYRDFYHFLEGLADYNAWEGQIDFSTPHRRLKRQASVWEDKTQIHEAFAAMLERWPSSILVLSYREDGIPSVEEITALLQARRREIQIHTLGYQYALSKKKACREVLWIAQ